MKYDMKLIELRYQIIQLSNQPYVRTLEEILHILGITKEFYETNFENTHVSSIVNQNLKNKLIYK